MILIFFCTFQDKISNSPKFKDFPGHSRTKFKFQDIPGFSRTVDTMHDNISSYADDTTLYSCAQDISSVISELQRIAKIIFDWCTNNHMKANPEKCHVILSSNTQREIRFANASIASCPSKKSHRITLDSELKFEKHINKICNIVNKKLNALHRIRSHMSLDKQKMFLRAFIESQFSYCPLIWMFH